MPSDRKPIAYLRPLTIAVLTLGTAALVGVAGVVYVERQAIGVRVAQDYLRAQGVPAAIRIERLDLAGVTGSARLGPAARPDLVAPRLVVTFAPWSTRSGPLAPPQVRSIVLDHPVLRGEWRQGRLVFGSLQRLIDQAARVKPTGRPAPDITIHDGRLILATPAGSLVVRIDTALQGGRLADLQARLQPASVAISGVKLAGLAGDLTAAPVGPSRLTVTAQIRAERADGRGVDALAPVLTAAGVVPDLMSAAPPGRIAALEAVLHLRTGQLAFAPGRGAPVMARTVDVGLRLDGELDRAGAYSGKVGLSGSAGQLRSAGSLVTAASVDLASPRVQARMVRGAVSGEGPFQLTMAAAGGQAATPYGAVALKPARLSARGRTSLGGATHLEASGALAAGASLGRASAERLAGRLAGAASPMARAIAAAVTTAELKAPAVAVNYDSRRGAALRLGRDLQLSLATGAVVIRSAGDAPLLQTHGRGDLLAVGGMTARLDQLPRVEIELANGRLTRDGAAEAAFTLAAQGDYGPVHAGAIHLAGTVSGGGGAWTLRTRGCAQLAAAILGDADHPYARDVKGQVCPTVDAPLVATTHRGWRIAAQLRDADFALPGAQVRAAIGDADVRASAEGRLVTGEARTSGLRLDDTSASLRFKPLQLEGSANLSRGVVTGGFSVALATSGRRIGELSVSDDLLGGRGQVRLDTGELMFDPKALKPADIAPLLADLLPDAKGGLSLLARADWSGGWLTSTSGVLASSGLAFRSPAGRLTGVRGQVQLTSLLPLQSAPRQTVTAERLDTVLPLTDLKAVFTLTPGAIFLDAAAAHAAGGGVSLDPMRLPLSGSPAGVAGVLRLNAIDLETVIGVLNLSNAVSIDAKVSGQLPFSVARSAGGFAPRIDHGRLYADGAGRLSIRRQALGAAVTTADGVGAQPSAVQDFAYQALENLAFSTLEADVASRPGGRLGAVLHVVGRHDPPQDRPTRIGLLALLRGHAFDKPLPLPKGTPVDLTLDTSLNLDELLAAYSAINARPGSAKVQP